MIAGNTTSSAFLQCPPLYRMIASKNICTICKSWLWDNTSIILGDHGHRLPRKKISRFCHTHDLDRRRHIDTTFNQTRPPPKPTTWMPTSLAQLGLRCPCLYLWQKMFVRFRDPRGFFAFNNGNRYVNKDNAVVFDNVGGGSRSRRGIFLTHSRSSKEDTVVVGIFGRKVDVSLIILLFTFYR